MRMVLVGPHEGMTITKSDVRFQDGVAEVPDHADVLQNILTRYHNAWPEEMVQVGSGGHLSVIGQEAPDEPQEATSSGEELQQEAPGGPEEAPDEPQEAPDEPQEAPDEPAKQQNSTPRQSRRQRQR